MDKHCDVYAYWGVSLSKKVGNEFLSECPFCKHNDTRSGMGHFYINETTAAFSCKSGSCGKEGSWRDFLYYIFESRRIRTTDDHLRRLVKDQGIPLPILKESGIAFDPRIHAFLYPIYNDAGEMIDIRVYRKAKKENSVKGCEVGLTNLKAILSATEETIYICEGWRDELALRWLFWRNGLSSQSIFTSVPGSNTFKHYWGTYFQNKNVVLCYDHDEAGYGTFDAQKQKATGSKKVDLIIRHNARSLCYTIWPKNYEKGYDARQFVLENKKDPAVGLKTFKSFIYDKHYLDQDTDELSVDDLKEKQKTNIKFKEITDKASETLYLDKDFLRAFRIAFATVVAAKFPGDINPWMFLVGSPSSGKTAVLGLFEDAPRHAVWESTLSATALVSGWGLGDNQNRVDPSILALVNEKCLVLKDFTEVLKKPQSERDEIFSILRGAFDGRVKKPFGTGVRQYICNFSLLAGVTHEIRAFNNTSVGERFLQYEFDPKIDIELIQEKALNSQLIGKSKTDELKNTVSTFLDNHYDLGGASLLGRVPQWFRDHSKPLARLVASLRTGVARYERGLKWSSMIYDPSPESPHRINMQLEKLAIALTLIDDVPEITEEIYADIAKVALDTAYSMSSKIVISLAKQDRSHTKDEIVKLSGVRSAGSYLEDLEILSMIEKNGQHSMQHAYKATKLIKDLWKRANVPNF